MDTEFIYTVLYERILFLLIWKEILKSNPSNVVPVKVNSVGSSGLWILNMH